MHIYIDESGPFLIPPQGEHRMNCVAALIIPAVVRDDLFYEFLRLRDTWPHNAIELKGSTLAESAVAAVVDLLHQFDVTMEVFCTDMGMYTQSELDAFQAEQARLITATLTPQHSDFIRKEFVSLRTALAGLPSQLFVQLVLLTFLIAEVIQTSTLYYCQRLPKDLGDFEWIVDAKDRTVTRSEDTWRRLLLPFLERASFRRPLITIVEGDYSAFERYFAGEDTEDETLRRHIGWLKTLPHVPSERFDGVNIKRLVGEQLYFRDSRTDLGIQLADIAANAFTRAFNGTLTETGWAGLGALMVRKADRSFHVKIENDLANGDRRQKTIDSPFAAVHQKFDDAAKSMFLNHE
jgi:hypothetical protein